MTVVRPDSTNSIYITVIIIRKIVVVSEIVLERSLFCTVLIKERNDIILSMPHTAKKPNLAARSGLLTSSTSELRRKTPYKIYSAFFTGYFDISESYAEIQMCK